MKVTNLTDRVLGLDGYIHFKPKSSTILIDTPENMERALRLQKAGLVKVEVEKLPPVTYMPAPEPVDEVTSPVEEPVASFAGEETAPVEDSEEEVVESTDSDGVVIKTKKSKKA